ncbi:MAG: TorF family putative porin [Thermodesulfobacteriota bacterium]
MKLCQQALKTTYLLVLVLVCLGVWLVPGTRALAQVPGEPAPSTDKGTPAPVAAEKAAAEEDKPTASVSFDILSQYIWRGIALSRRSAVIQPSVTIGYKGFSLNIWGNLDTGEDNRFLYPQPGKRGVKWNETDFTFGYSRELYTGKAIKSISGNVGVIYYALDGIDDSFEIYWGLAMDVNWFKLAATVNKEVLHYPGWWLTLGISRVFEFPWKIQNNSNVSLELGHNFVFLFSEDEAAYPNPNRASLSTPFSGPLAGQLYATLNIPVHKYVTLAPKVGFWYALGGNSTDLLGNGGAKQYMQGLSWDSQHNHIYGGLNLTFAF